MNVIDQINFYAVSADLSVIKHVDFDSAIKTEGFLYCIKETRSTWKNTVDSYVKGRGKITFPNYAVLIELFDQKGLPFEMAERRWTGNNIKASPSYYGNGYHTTNIKMDFVSPNMEIASVISSATYYHGIFELHKLLRQLSKIENICLKNL